MSDHSSVASGGEANITKWRAVSAPYRSIRSSGSTPFLSDFDIFETPPYSTPVPSASRPPAMRPSSPTIGVTSAGGWYSMPPLSFRVYQLWLSTIPCVSRRVNGSSKVTSPMSRITLVQNRA